MKKTAATLIFYWTSSAEDIAVLKRLQRLIRRENVPIIRDEHSCNADTSVFPPEVLRELLSDENFLNDPRLPYEHRYKVSVEMRDPQRLFALVAWLRSYGEYIGMSSRLFWWGLRHDS